MLNIYFLHLIPGILYMFLYVPLSKFLYKKGLPPAFSDAIASPLMAGVFVFFIWQAQISIKDVFMTQGSLSITALIMYSVISLFWAVLVFMLMQPVGDYIYKKFFNWFPNYLNLADHIENKSTYTRKVVIGAWAVSAVINSFFMPVAEEIYFRGYLLPQMEHALALSVLIHTTLFAIYHFWSPWQIPTRIVALFPMVYFIAITGNIYIGVIVHVLLNVVGDTLTTIPIVFRKQQA